MKKITLMAALMIGAITFAQTDLSYTADTTITNGVLCSAGNPGDINGSYSFVLGDFGVDPALDFQVTEVRFGASSLDNAPAGGLQATINVYTTDAPYPNGTLTIAGTTTFDMLPGTEGTQYSVPIDATVPGDAEIVVEVQFPNDGVTVGAIGTNEEGTSVSWATGCDGGVAVPTDLEDFTITADWTIEATGDSVLGINDNIADAISIFPNPTTDLLNVRVPSNVEVQGVDMYDILGKDTGAQLVNGTINTSNLARGVYILNVRTSAGTLTEKIVKQ